MSIPNMISVGRILLVPVFTLLYTRGNVMAAMGVLMLAGASDVLDGAIARRFHMETALGRALDPVADKLLQAAMMLCAMRRTPSLWLLLGLHIFRELSLGVMSLHVLRITGYVCSARWYGKVCSVCIYVVMIAALAFSGIPEWLIDMGVTLCGAGMALCLLGYMLNFQKILLRQGEER